MRLCSVAIPYKLLEGAFCKRWSSDCRAQQASYYDAHRHGADITSILEYPIMASPIAVLFDLSFTEFITTRVIKVFFILGVVFAALITLMVIVGGFQVGSAVGVIVLLLSPVLFLLYILMLRLWCEFIIVVFRIAENTGRMAEQGRVTAPPVSSADEA